MKNKKIGWITKVAILAAFSTVLYFLRFSLPIFPEFLKIQLSNLPVAIGGFMLGPLGGLAILLVRTVITLPFTVTSTVGELADFLIGAGFLLASSLIYKKIRSRKGGLLGLIAGALCWVIVACLINYFILIPFYIALVCKGDVINFIGMCSIIPVELTVENYKWMYILYAALPFNLITATAVSLVTFLVYKRLSILFSKIDDVNDHDETEENKKIS